MDRVPTGTLVGWPYAAAVPNLWVATPRGVPIIFHWGRHWWSDIEESHAQLHIHNVRSCLCQKLCSVKIDYIYYYTVLYTNRNITGQ